MTDAHCQHGSLLLPPDSEWPAGPWTPYCRTCWLATRGRGPVALPVATLECPHRGGVLEFCTRCGPAGEGRHIRDCDVYERCSLTHRPDVPGLMSCDRCEVPVSKISKVAPG